MARHNGGLGGSNRKYHQPKRGVRAKSHYPDRLSARGLSSARVRMPTLESLRKKQLGQAADDFAAEKQLAEIDFEAERISKRNFEIVA